MPGHVFVTVGTTKFDALIKAIDKIEIADTLIRKGYDRLTIQKGAGRYQLSTLVPLGQTQHALQNGLQVTVFEFAPSLATYMQQADLIISHAGSGSIFEGLRLGKPLIAVPNAILMDNHQAELADHLAKLGHTLAATPDTLVDVLCYLETDGLKPYQSGDAQGIVRQIEALVMSHPQTKLDDRGRRVMTCLTWVLLIMILIFWARPKR